MLLATKRRCKMQRVSAHFLTFRNERSMELKFLVFKTCIKLKIQMGVIGG